MIKKNIKYFSLREIMNSGQIFRMYEPDEGHFIVFSADRKLELFQDGENITFNCDEKDFYDYWEPYFDLKRNYGEIVSKAMDLSGSRGREFIKKAANYASGIRILKQDVWEMMVSFIISQQKQIPSIRKCIEGLCERFGNRHDGWYGFPEAKTIAEQGPDGLKGLSLGYRERYIYETAVKYLADGGIRKDLLNADYGDVKKYLCTFSGIGEKVSDCICLFGFGFIDSFPIDVHIKDLLMRYFMDEDKKVSGKSLSYADYMNIIDENFSEFSGERGIVQQWIFAYELSCIKNEKKF